MGKKENEDEERKPGFGCDLAPKIPEGKYSNLFNSHVRLTWSNRILLGGRKCNNNQNYCYNIERKSGE